MQFNSEDPSSHICYLHPCQRYKLTLLGTEQIFQAPVNVFKFPDKTENTIISY